MALHIRPHQRAVGLVVLEKWNQPGRRADELERRNIHVVNRFGVDHGKIAPSPRLHHIVFKRAILLEHHIGLRDGVAVFFIGGQIRNFLCYFAIFDHPVRRFEKPKGIDFGISRHRHDQPDIRPLGRFDGADAPVVRVVDIAHLKPGAVAR